MALLGRVAPIVTGGSKGGLLSVARPLPSGTHWQQGINYNANCGAEVGYANCVDPGSPVDKSIADVGEIVEMLPFILHSGSQCSTWFDGQDLLDLARSGYVRGESEAFAMQLQADAAGNGNPTLNSTATDITPATPADVTNTLSGLTAAAMDCGMNDLVFHMNRRIIPFLLERHLIEWDAATGRWMYGPYPFSFDGYGPIGPGGVSETSASESWMYVSGPIEIESGPELRAPGEPVVRTNYALELIEHLAILRFDPCCVQAAIAEVS